MPDGNSRFANKENISLDEAYILGGKTLKLFTEFFLLDKRANALIYHALSDYTHRRTNDSLAAIYSAANQTLNNLLSEDFFSQHNIAFKAFDHSGKMPKDVEAIVRELSSKNHKHMKRAVIVLLGYSLDKDEEQIIPEIDLVIRNMEMRLSRGPVYAMSQAQMIILNKLNPEVTAEDLQKMWSEYQEHLIYRESCNLIRDK